MKVFLHIKSIAENAHGMLVSDAIGASSLVVILVVGLHLPVFF